MTQTDSIAFAKTVETHLDVHLQNEWKPTSQLEDYVQKVLELSAPDVTGNDLNDLRALGPGDNSAGPKSLQFPSSTCKKEERKCAGLY